MDPLDLLKAAGDLVSSNKGKPRQANLLRAISTIYYALFHVLAKACADLLIGASPSARKEETWRQVYRALDHARARSACKNKIEMEKFPQEVQDFAALFVSMQDKRHKADYHPKTRVYKSDVLFDIETTKTAIEQFEKAFALEKRSFLALILFKQRP